MYCMYVCCIFAYVDNNLQKAGKPEQKIIVYFMSSEDATDYMNEIAQGNAAMASEFRITTVSMEKVCSHIQTSIHTHTHTHIYIYNLSAARLSRTGVHSNPVSQAEPQTGSLQDGHYFPHPSTRQCPDFSF
jgi:hypothetical protein